MNADTKARRVALGDYGGDYTMEYFPLIQAVADDDRGHRRVQLDLDKVKAWFKKNAEQWQKTWDETTTWRVFVEFYDASELELTNGYLPLDEALEVLYRVLESYRK